MRADATLQVGNTGEKVEVAANAIQLQTEDAKNSVTLQNKLVNDLPLEVNGTVRTPFDLASLTPDAKNLGGDNGFSVGGGQAASYGTSLDGVSTNTSRALSKSWVASNSPSVEAIDQFTVDTNGYKAEYGHAGGGNHELCLQVGNQSSSTARLTSSCATTTSMPTTGSATGPVFRISIYKQNDFGATVGGPVWIPKVYHGKDKTFFFFSYEGFRNRTGANGTVFTVPTPEMYNGDFSKWVTSAGVQIPIYNPAHPGDQRRWHCHPTGIPGQHGSQEPFQRGRAEGAGRFPDERDAVAQQRALLRVRPATCRTTIWKPAAPRYTR